MSPYFFNTYHVGQRWVPLAVEHEAAVESGNDVRPLDVALEGVHEGLVVGLDEQVPDGGFGSNPGQGRAHGDEVFLAGIVATVGAKEEVELASEVTHWTENSLPLWAGRFQTQPSPVIFF